MRFKLAIIVFCTYSRMARESSLSHHGGFLVFDKLPSENMLGQILKYFVWGYLKDTIKTSQCWEGKYKDVSI